MMTRARLITMLHWSVWWDVTIAYILGRLSQVAAFKKQTIFEFQKTPGDMAKCFITLLVLAAVYAANGKCVVGAYLCGYDNKYVCICTCVRL